MHEMNNGMRIWSAKNESLSSSVSVSEETNVCETNASLDGMHTHVRTSFSDMMDKNHAVQAMEEYISPRTGGYLSICLYIWWMTWFDLFSHTYPPYLFLSFIIVYCLSLF